MNAVTKADVIEVKSLASPPTLVIQVLKITMLLLGHPEAEVQDYRRIKAVLAKADFLKRMANLDLDSVSADVAQRAGELAKEINVDSVRKVSAASAGFFLWNQAVIQAVKARAS